MIADELNKLKQTKAAIKLALIDKGQNPTDEFASYVGNIGAIATSNSANNAEVHYSSELDNTTATSEEYNALYSPDCEYPIFIVDVSQAQPLNNWNFPKAKKLVGFPNNAMNINTTGSFTYNVPNAEKLLYLSFGNGKNKIISSNKLKDITNLNGSNYCTIEISDTTGIEIMDKAFYKGMSAGTYTFSLPNLKSAEGAFKLLSTTALYNFTLNDLNNVFNASSMFQSNGSNTNYNITISTNVDSWKVSDASYMFNSFKPNFSIPTIDLEYCKSASYMFNYCKERTDFPIINTLNVENFNAMFNYCQAMTELPSTLDFSSATDIGSMCYYCSALTYVPKMNNKKALLYSPFNMCKNLIKIEECYSGESDINGYYTRNASLGASLNSLRYALIKDIGNNRGTTSYYLKFDASGALYWGVEDETIPLSAGARQSLIDSLITYSVDRINSEDFKTSNGELLSYTITLHANTKALLTEDEIAQITAKGFTLA